MLDIHKAKGSEDHIKPPMRLLGRLEKELKQKSPRFYFPTFWKEKKHWIVFRIDFEMGVLTYGENHD
jgi:hypothetical protein